jgi:hypothetical protein
MATINIDSLYARLLRSSAGSYRKSREQMQSLLFASLVGQPPSNFDVLREPLIYLSNTFSRYASNQPTAYENGSVPSTTSTGTSNLLKSQVERALAQVLGRSPGRNPNSFIQALNEAFPLTKNGQVSTVPSRSTLSLYSSNGTGNMPEMMGEISAGIAGQISAEQATLYRQASVIGNDAIKVLDGLEPFTPLADRDRVEALRSLVRSEINSLIDEFGRLDEPRKQRVETYFDALIGSNGHLDRFGQSAFLDRRNSTATTTNDEAQIAGFELVKNYAKRLQDIWNDYLNLSNPQPNSNILLFSERISRASVLLPVIAESNASFMAAMDSIGFTESERRSNAAKFTSLNENDTSLPDITVNDLNEWLDRFATIEGPYLLADSGQYGLDFVTNQADKLFLVFVPILAQIKVARNLNLSTMPPLAQVLVHERVSWTLDQLLSQLGALADLAA